MLSAKFGPDPYPYYTSPERNYLLMCDAVGQEIANSPHCFEIAHTPTDISRIHKKSKIGIVFLGRFVASSDPSVEDVIILAKVSHCSGAK